MRLGHLIAGRFELLRLAGEGGMGTVWRALDRATGLPAALKILRVEAQGSAARFIHEARILAALDHPHIVRYVAHGVTEDGEPYIAMEWLEGETLDDRLVRGGLELEDVLDIAARVAAALGAAHARGVVHRDIKPSNLLLAGGRAADVRVLDFGIARRVGVTGTWTRMGAILGTAGYMAPEQARGERRVGPPADVFGLGAVLFECLSGTPAFEGSNAVAALAKVLFDEPPPLAELRPAVPAPLAALIGRMLAKDPDARPADGAAVALAIEELRAGADAPPASGALSPAITPVERRLASVVGVAPAPPPARSGDETLVARGALGPVAELTRRAALPLGARVEVLANDVIVAALLGEGSATDQTAAAARCALAIKAAAPAETVVLVTVRGASQDRLPLGEALDRVAAALEAAEDDGAPGEVVRIDAVTRALLDPRFDVIDDGGRLLLRGERRAAEEARLLLGRTSPFVGRERELMNILGLVDEGVEERRTTVILVTAPPGMGKSRLRQELTRAIRERHPDAQLLLARADAVGAGSALSLLSSALSGALALTGRERDDPAEAQRRELRRLAGEAHAPFLGVLLGVSSPDEDDARLRAARASPHLMLDRIQAAWIDLLAGMTAGGPAVLLLEDLHWADAPSLKILDAALRDLSDRPFAILAFARPEIHELYPRLWAERGAHEVRLGALPRRAAAELVRSALGAGLDPARAAALVDRAQGNAFYLEELIRAVAEGRGDALPDTVLGMVEARLASLEPDARRLLRAASIFGEVFWTDGARYLLGAASIEPLLDPLCRAELIAPRARSRFAGQDELAFRHGLIREAAYAMLADSDRRLGHRLAAEWLVQAGEADALVLAEHHRAGGQEGRAASFYLHAGVQSLERNDPDGALLSAERGVSCGAAGELLGTLRAVAAMARCYRAEHDAALVEVRLALPLLAPGGRWTCLALCYGLWAALVEGAEPDFDRMSAALAHFEPDAGARRDYLSRVPLVVSIGATHGRRDLCRFLLDRVDDLLAEAATVDLDLLGVLAIGRSDALRSFGQDPWTPLCLLRDAVHDYEALQDHRNAITALSRLGQAQADLGDPDAGEETLRRALSLAQRLRVAFIQRQCEMHLAALLCQLPDEAKRAEADALARAALAAPGLMAGYRGWARGIRAEVLLARGEAEEALREAMEAEALCARITPRRIWAVTLRIRAHLGRGEAAAARSAARLLDEALGSLGGGGYVAVEARLAQAEAYLAAGAREEGRAALGEASRQIEARAAAIPDPEWRGRYLRQGPGVRRALALAEGEVGQGGGEDGEGSGGCAGVSREISPGVPR